MATKAQGASTGTLLGILLSGGQWLAVVQAIGTSRAHDPIITAIRPLDELKGPQRRKADRWIAALGIE